MLELEVCTTVFRSQSDIVKKQIVITRELGVTISLDNVDSLSSLEVLAEAPIQKVKIGRELISSIPASSKAVVLMRTIATLTLELGYELACNGLETEEQYQTLLGAGCQLGQGYLLYKPATADSIESVLPKRK